jgi:hypothetical protein
MKSEVTKYLVRISFRLQNTIATQRNAIAASQ